MSMEQINGLYEAIKRADERLKVAKEEADAAQKDYDRLSKDLGEILYAQGMSAVKMADGRELGLKTTYFGSAAQDRIEAIRQFLRERGNEGILKPKKLNISEDDLDSLPPELADKVAYEINTNTLKAFLAELARKNELNDQVFQLFAVHTENRVILE